MTGIPSPCLCLVTDRAQCEGRPLDEVVDQAVQGGVNMVQLREKDMAAGQLYSLANRVREVIGGRALLIINDRIDVALACGADGLQLGEEGLPLSAAREVARGRLVLGRSVHSVEGAVLAESEGADFLVVGTIFTTNSHPGGEAAGVGLLEQIGQHIQISYLGIGGINSSNAGLVMSAGASGVALITGITRSSQPTEAAKELIQVMNLAQKSGSGERLARKA